MADLRSVENNYENFTMSYTVVKSVNFIGEILIFFCIFAQYIDCGCKLDVGLF